MLENSPKNALKALYSKDVVLATHNAGKVSELREALLPFGWTLKGAADLNLEVPEEYGTIFRKNAELKAIAATKATGFAALADDSGLEVEALGGLPGINTSSYGGWNVLLEALKDIPMEQRAARFMCVLALHIPGETTLFFEGSCEGTIADSGRGEGGFGYDPVFIPTGSATTFAEMTTAEKYSYSHRGRAIEALKTFLKQNA